MAADVGPAVREDRGSGAIAPAAEAVRVRPTSIRLLCLLFYPELVSTGQSLTELAEELAARGVDVEVTAGPPTFVDRHQAVPRQMEYRGIRIRRVWGTRFPKLRLMGRICNQASFALSAMLDQVVRRRRVPILVLTEPPFLAWSCAVLRALRWGPPYAYVIFDVYPDTAVHLGVIRPGGGIARAWERLNAFTLRHADHIVVIGRCMRDVISAKVEAAVADRIRFIHMWADDVNIQAHSAGPNPYVGRWGLESRFVVGYFGNMGRFHDLETIMETANLLRTHAEIVFLFVGEGHKKRYAMEYAQDHGLGNCRFHTYVPREDLGYALATAAVGLVSLARGQEGLSVPSKAFGLMAAGIPVVAVMGRTSEVARMVEEQGCGVVVPQGESKRLAETILQLHQDPARLESLGQNGVRAIREKYSLAMAAEDYLKLIAELN
jgi:colanic acid biosynthesis glycosyl transferase WcaI